MNSKCNRWKNDMNTRDVAAALSCLRENGLPINIPENLKKSLDEEFLFDGDDWLFKESMAACEKYGEYGCGKSTLWVQKNYPKTLICAVDTSVQWVTRVNSQLAMSSGVVTHVDVGEVGDWGRPLGYGSRKNFLRYAESIWDKNQDYDLVLVDGRFRVLSFLTSLLRCEEGTRIIFDDYTNRRHYHVVEEFIKPVDYCGRQALFVVGNKSAIDLSDVERERNLFAYVID